eukprot:1001823-Pyramimonas_sp.AAC.1
MYDFFESRENESPETGLFTSAPVAEGAVYATAAEIGSVFVDPFVVPGQTTSVDLDTEYTVVMIAKLAGGAYTVARRAGLVSSSTTPYVNNMEVAYNADTVAADITQVDLHVPVSHSETVSFYAAATTYPVTSVSAPSPASVPYAARVTIASRLDATATGVAIPSAFPKVLDANGDLVDFSSVRTAYAYAWAQGDTTGNIHPMHIAANGFDHPDTFPKLKAVTVNPTELTLTVESATLFSAKNSLVEYRIFAMKDPVATDPAAVLSFVNTGVLDQNTDFTASQYTALGEKYTFPTPWPQDDLFEVPGYFAVMTKAFTSTGDASQTEDITAGNSYKVYLAVKDSAGTWTIHAYPTVLFVSSEFQAVSLADATSSDPSTLTNTGTTLTVSITTTHTAGVYAYDTGIQIDLVNDAGTEIWFDYEVISGYDNGKLVPCIIDPTTTDLSSVDWINSVVYSAGDIYMTNGDTFLFRMDDWTATTKYSWSRHGTFSYNNKIANVANVFNTMYVVMKVLETDGRIAGYKEVEFRIYDGPERLDSQLIVTTRMTGYVNVDGTPPANTPPPPGSSTLVFGVNVWQDKGPVFTLSNFKTNKPDTTVAQIGAIQNVTFDNSVQNHHTVSFGLESLTSSSTENAKVYAVLSTRDLKYEKHATSVGQYKNALYSLESKLEPIMEIPAGTSVDASAIQAQEAVTGGWVLISRGVVGQTPYFDLNQNIESDENNFDVNFSRLLDLKNGDGLLTDADIKIGGKYKFRLIPYGSTDPRLPADNETKYIEWTQTSNPATNTDVVEGFVLGEYAPVEEFPNIFLK